MGSEVNHLKDKITELSEFIINSRLKESYPEIISFLKEILPAEIIHGLQINENHSLQFQLLESISLLQSEFLKKGIYYGWCDKILEKLLQLTNSKFGFICELFHKDDGTPYIKSHGITNISWNEETDNFYKANIEKGLEFFNFNSIWGHPMITGEAYISNDPDNDPHRGGYPKEKGHPEMKAFLGIPIKNSKNEVIGIIGVANNPNGYNMKIVEFLSPFITTYGLLIEKSRKDIQQKIDKEKAEESEKKLIEAQELSHMGSWEYIVETDTVIWSKELFNIFERSPELGAPNYSEQQPFYTEESFAMLNKAVQDCIQNDIPYDIQLDIYTSSGSVKHIISKGNAKKDKNNKTIGCYGTAQDITLQKKMEAELVKYRVHLERLVEERTKELEIKNQELEKFNQLFIGREFRIKELKDKIKELEILLKNCGNNN